MRFSPGAHVAQLVERLLGKDEVISSILIVGSILLRPSIRSAWVGLRRNKFL